MAGISIQSGLEGGSVCRADGPGIAGPPFAGEPAPGRGGCGACRCEPTAAATAASPPTVSMAAAAVTTRARRPLDIGASNRKRGEGSGLPGEPPTAGQQRHAAEGQCATRGEQADVLGACGRAPTGLHPAGRHRGHLRRA